MAERNNRGEGRDKHKKKKEKIRCGLTCTCVEECDFDFLICLLACFCGEIDFPYLETYCKSGSCTHG